MSEHGHKKKSKANRRRRPKQALEIEACSMALFLRIASEMIHHLAPGSPQTHFKPQHPLPLSLGQCKLAKKREREKKKLSKKQKKKKAKKRRSKKGVKIKVYSKKKKASSTIPSLTQS